MRGGQKENDTIAGQHMQTRDGDGNRRRISDRTKTRNSPYTYTSLSNANELPIPARSTHYRTQGRRQHDVPGVRREKKDLLGRPSGARPLISFSHNNTSGRKAADKRQEQFNMTTIETDGVRRYTGDDTPTNSAYSGRSQPSCAPRRTPDGAGGTVPPAGFVGLCVPRLDAGHGGGGARPAP